MAETRVTRLRAQPRAWTAPERWRANQFIWQVPRILKAAHRLQRKLHRQSRWSQVALNHSWSSLLRTMTPCSSYASRRSPRYSLVLAVTCPKPGQVNGNVIQVIASSSSMPSLSATAIAASGSLSSGQRSSSKVTQASFSSSTLISASKAPSRSPGLVASSRSAIRRSKEILSSSSLRVGLESTTSILGSGRFRPSTHSTALGSSSPPSNHHGDVKIFRGDAPQLGQCQRLSAICAPVILPSQ
mmetsp:Transcript_29579/g.58344  ORF Transcript_29579/g.58344 Transcript_29579/m.58344 type:complete len:243 (-) Transcript_29579:2578-3306(-)